MWYVLFVSQFFFFPFASMDVSHAYWSVTGGHSNTGFSVVDGSVLIDMSPINHIQVDEKNKLIHIGGGCLWGYASSYGKTCLTR
jgi:hypothetical protein